MRGLATLLSVVGYVWCAMVGVYVGYTAAVSVAPPCPYVRFSGSLDGAGLARHHGVVVSEIQVHLTGG